MTEGEVSTHPALETLADFAEGQLPAEEAGSIEAHVRACARCRLEAKRIVRFAAIDSDRELIEEADWPRVSAALDAVFQERIRSAVAGGGIAGSISRRRRTGLRWLAPAAAIAAAAAVLLTLRSDRPPERAPAPSRTGVVRGGEAAEATIAPESPVGERVDPPDLFAWSSRKKYESYTLEIFSADLAAVFRESGIPETHFAVTDSLRGLLLPERDYLWTVQGRSGLAPPVVSACAWFKITPDRTPSIPE